MLRTSPGRYQSGVSLIEVLVTTVVLSLGVLGVAGLGAFAKRSTFEAVQRSVASEMGYALLEEMRMNKAALGTYVAAAALGGGTLGAEPAPDCDAPNANCNASELATHSLWLWERMIDSGMESNAGVESGGLLSPSACIAGPAGGATGVYTVTVVWRGVTEIADSGLTNCGNAKGLYGAGNAFRRVVIVQSYIDPTV
ncbi:MAG TPA: type IV pilus modification protein PilV [Gammaproteobacteria bacterium]|nr:type IV pilus modification protein PilV [Gammaproteobacteria bacterium]